MIRKQKRMGPVGCFGQIENIKRQSLYYNPYDVEKTVTYQTSEKADIFDIISKTFLSKGVAGEG